MMRIMEVSARVFYEERNEPIVYITFAARGWARQVEWSLEEASNLGKMLFAKGYHFHPWTGIVFGWRAYRDEERAQRQRCQSEAYEKLKAII